MWTEKYIQIEIVEMKGKNDPIISNPIYKVKIVLKQGILGSKHKYT